LLRAAPWLGRFDYLNAFGDKFREDHFESLFANLVGLMVRDGPTFADRNAWQFRPALARRYFDGVIVDLLDAEGKLYQEHFSISEKPEGGIALRMLQG
jgi:hypothetical protein